MDFEYIVENLDRMVERIDSIRLGRLVLGDCNRKWSYKEYFYWGFKYIVEYIVENLAIRGLRPRVPRRGTLM